MSGKNTNICARQRGWMQQCNNNVTAVKEQCNNIVTTV
jgi:hypothetical protein